MSYHRGKDTGATIEVFKGDEYLMDHRPGWYFWPCSPGCLPDVSDDSQADGPHPSREAALAEAFTDEAWEDL